MERRRPTRADRAAGVLETACPLSMVAPYVERNPLRAKRVAQAEEWAWSSLGYSAQLAEAPGWVETSWLTRPAGWLATVNGTESAEDLAAVRQSIARGRPLGRESWVRRIAAALGLESSLRPRGRPTKRPKQ